MTRALLAIAFLSLTASCKESGPDNPSDAGATSALEPTASAPAETVFRGNYRSNW